MTNIFHILQKRRLLNQITHQSLMSDPPSTSKSVYVGFDPTAESLHLGNFVSLVALNWFRAIGYQPIVLFGGATGLIGDPSGKSNERNLLHPDDVEKNVASFQTQFKIIENNFAKHLPKLDYKTPLKDVKYVNNLEFYRDLGMLNFLRDIGKHFRVNSMISKDSVKNRLNSVDASDGLSFTEFTY